MSALFPPERTRLPFASSRGAPPPDRRLGKQGGVAHHFSPILKRCFDVVGAATLLLLVAPVLPLIMIVIRLDGGPVFYRHTRIGSDNRPFGCLKFRTMSVASERLLMEHLAADPAAAAEWAKLRKLSNDPRVTRIGAVLRASSLDELPQLLNVLRGQMSLVGPRPVVREELDTHYGPAGRRAYAATRPGLTGLWQISGRSDTTYDERVSLDIAYVEKRSLLLDLRILFSTISVVIGRRGAW